MGIKRLLTVLGLLMIGEGLVAMIHPTRYVQLWRVGPEPVRDTVDTLAAHPETTRTIGALELAAGLLLALRETRDTP